MNSYQGFTLTDLNTRFTYDPDRGVVVYKKTKVLQERRFKVRNPKGDLVTVSVPRVAVMIHNQEILDDDLMVRLRDGNDYNLSIDNLVVAHSREGNLGEETLVKYVETATRGVFYGHHSELFVVRRGKTQAVYRTPDYKEAVSVRKEWEKDKTIHRWDRFTPEWLLPALN